MTEGQVEELREVVLQALESVPDEEQRAHMQERAAAATAPELLGLYRMLQGGGEDEDDMDDARVEELRMLCMQAIDQLPDEEQRAQWQARVMEAEASELLHIYQQFADGVEGGVGSDEEGQDAPPIKDVTEVEEQREEVLFDASTMIQAHYRGAKVRTDAGEQAKEEAEEQAKQEAAEQAKKEAEEQAKKEAEEQATKEAEDQAKKAKQEAVEQAEQAKQEAEEQAKQEAAEQAKQEAAEQLKTETEKQGKEEADAKTIQEAAAKAEQEAAAKAKQEAAAKVEQEATAKLEQEAAVKAKQEASAKVEKEAAAKAKQEAAAKAKQEATAKLEQEAAAKAKQEATAKLEQEAAAKAKQEATTKLKQEAAAKAKQEAAAKLEQEAAAKAKQEATARLEQEAAAKARNEATAKAKQEAAAKAKQEAAAKATQEAAAKATQEAAAKAKRAKKEAELKARKAADDEALQRTAAAITAAVVDVAATTFPTQVKPFMSPTSSPGEERSAAEMYILTSTAEIDPTVGFAAPAPTISATSPTPTKAELKLLRAQVEQLQSQLAAAPAPTSAPVLTPQVPPATRSQPRAPQQPSQQPSQQFEWEVGETRERMLCAAKSMESSGRGSKPGGIWRCSWHQASAIVYVYLGDSATAQPVDLMQVAAAVGRYSKRWEAVTSDMCSLRWLDCSSAGSVVSGRSQPRLLVRVDIAHLDQILQKGSDRTPDPLASVGTSTRSVNLTPFTFARRDGNNATESAAAELAATLEEFLLCGSPADVYV
jgi:colicin import membrane protein